MKPINEDVLSRLSNLWILNTSEAFPKRHADKFPSLMRAYERVYVCFPGVRAKPPATGGK